MNPLPDALPAIVPTRAGYDQWSDRYDTDGNPILALEEPEVDHLLGDVAGLSVLDVGCGTGRHALRLAAAGAAVHAIDFSSGMLHQARQKPGSAAVHFQVHDLSQPLPLADATFDRVICGLVLDHISDLENLFREMLRVCRPAGAVVVSIMHPAMMLRGVQARFRDAGGHEIRPASCPHQLTDYIMAATRAGAILDHLSEHAVTEALAERWERARKHLHWPMLFMMRLLPRPASASPAQSSALPSTRQSLGLVSLLVRDYDEALAFFIGKLGFRLIEDTPIPEQSKRWVVIAPPGGAGSHLLLARASTPEQQSRIGAQTGGRVFLFLHTNDFWRDHHHYTAQGIEFVRPPKTEPYGTVAVFKDLYGNLWDLLEPAQPATQKPNAIAQSLCGTAKT